MDKLLIWVVILISGLVKLIGVNQSLWLDEAISAQVVKVYSIFEIPIKFSISDFHPPIYYMFLKLWTSVFGYSELSLRLPSIIFSLITIYVVYLIAKQISNKRTALWAAIFTGFNPLLIYYSQETRMYSMSTLWLTLAVYFFVKLDKKVNKKDLILFNIFSGLSFATFYGSVFLIAALDIIWLFKKKIKLIFLANIGMIVSCGLLAPLLIKQMTLSKTLLIDVKNWSSVLGNVTFKNLILIPIKFTSGRISYSPKIIYFGVAAVWAGMVFLAALLGSIKKPKIFWALVLPLILGLIFSIFSPLMQYFRFQYLIPILSILIAIGLTKEKNRLVYAIIFLGFGSLYLFNDKMYREDWKSLAKNINPNETVYIIESKSDPIKYYQPTAKIKDIQTVIPTESLITVIPYAEAIHGFDHRQKLEQLGYSKIEEKDFREVTMEKWFKN